MNAPERLALATTAPSVDRRKFLGGSDASVVLGINPWRTQLDLWRDKTQPAIPENLDPARRRVLDRGKRMEPYVVDMLAAETGVLIVERNARYIDPEFGFLACEVDAEAVNDDSNLRLNIEIKTVSPFKAKEWGELGSDEIPVHYTAQAQHGLMITGRSLCIFGVLIGGDDFRVYNVERDDEIIEAMRRREVAFWREHVETLTPPPPSNAADVLAMFSRDSGAAVEATPDVLAAISRLHHLKADADHIERLVADAKGLVQAHMRDAARVLHDGRDVATWKTQQARRFDQRALQEAHPDIFEKFIKTTEMRVFRVK